MEITEVKVFPVREEKLKAFVSVVFDECFMVNDIKVISGRDGLFISMPSRRKKNGKFKDVAHPLNNETRQRMERRILDAYEMSAGGDGQRESKQVAERRQASVTPSGHAEQAAEPASEQASEGRSLDEVAEAHLRDSFWGT
jgi:stage V sporulation protein G